MYERRPECESREADVAVIESQPTPAPSARFELAPIMGRGILIWEVRRQRMSPHYTTRPDEIAVAYAR